MVSAPEVIDSCFDKYRTKTMLDAIGLATPKTYLSLKAALAALDGGEIHYPVVVKPRWGTASIGTERIREHRLDLSTIYQFDRKPLERALRYLFVGG